MSQDVIASAAKQSLTWVAWATTRLEQAGVPRPRWSAEQLLSSALGVEPISLFLERPVASEKKELRFRRAVALRADRMPLQYLLGSAAFYGREFAVGPGVFVPRPETEILIDTALKILAQRLRNSETQKLFVLDVGTGSGAIAITLASEYPKAFYVGVDPSSAALSFARRNASRHHAAIAFFQADLAEIFQRRSLDLIVANLPYLDPAVSSGWPRELAWEPWMSLNGGKGGLSWIEKLIGQAKGCLRPGGFLILEIGDGQGQTVCRMAEAHAFQLEEIVPDLAGKERVVVLRMPWKN